MFLFNGKQKKKHSGPWKEGIFRLSVSPGETKVLKVSIDAGTAPPLDTINPHELAALLKYYIREMSEPILPFNICEQIVNISSVEKEHLLNVVNALPPTNLEMFVYLVSLLFVISRHADVNKMTAENLAIIFAQNVSQPPQFTPKMLEVLAKFSPILEAYITNCMDILPNAPTVVGQLQQLVPAATPTDTTTTTDEKGKGKAETTGHLPRAGSTSHRSLGQTSAAFLHHRNNLVSILVHKTSPLPSPIDIPLLVQVHLFDPNVGAHLPTSSPDGGQKAVRTLPTSTTGNFALWEEEIIFALDYDAVVSGRAVLLFEVLSLSSTSTTNIAWACLVPGDLDITQTGKQMQLPLFSYPSPEVDVFSCWNSSHKAEYSASIFVTLQTKHIPRKEEELPPTAKTPHAELEIEALDIPKWRKEPDTPFSVPNSILTTLTAGDQGAHMAQFSRNGHYIAIVCIMDGVYPIALYNVHSWKLQVKFSGHSQIINDLQWSSDDKHILSSSVDNSVKVWGYQQEDMWKKEMNITQVNDPILVLAHPARVFCAKFSKRDLIISGSEDCVLRLWSFPRGELVQTLQSHSSPVTSLCVFENSPVSFASGDNAGYIKIWREETSASGTGNFVVKRTTRTYNAQPVSHLASTLESHDCMMLAQSRGVAASVSLLDMLTLSTRNVYTGLPNPTWPVRPSWSPDCRYIASGAEDGKLYIWSSEDGKICRVLHKSGLPKVLSSVCWNRCDDLVAICGPGGNVPVVILSCDPHGAPPTQVHVYLLPDAECLSPAVNPKVAPFISALTGVWDSAAATTSTPTTTTTTTTTTTSGSSSTNTTGTTSGPVNSPHSTHHHRHTTKSRPDSSRNRSSTPSKRLSGSHTSTHTSTANATATATATATTTTDSL
ncbi:AHI1 protein [Pelomyxa schiedti]|nr:AHI1 protein [Pelomyxa schiedti]